LRLQVTQNVAKIKEESDTEDTEEAMSNRRQLVSNERTRNGVSQLTSEMISLLSQFGQAGQQQGNFQQHQQQPLFGACSAFSQPQPPQGYSGNSAFSYNSGNYHTFPFNAQNTPQAFMQYFPVQRF
jgi:hypothetical protein